jgi:hypothetical protein
VRNADTISTEVVGCQLGSTRLRARSSLRLPAYLLLVVTANAVIADTPLHLIVGSGYGLTFSCLLAEYGAHDHTQLQNMNGARVLRVPGFGLGT